MANELIDNNTYYPAKNITIFPSSNAVDSGKLFTEFNGRNITINITDLNYVISPNPDGYSISYNGSDMSIQPGKALINGFEINTDIDISYRLPTAEEIVNEGYYTGYALLCLHTKFDELENLSGNVRVAETETTSNGEEQIKYNWYCSGIAVEYVSYSDYNTKPNEYLLLGGVKTDGSIKINKNRFLRLDSKHILVTLESDPETGVPPTQTASLTEFINGFLKGYWVSKAGDNEYGELLFKTMPENYLEEGFDYKTEDALNSSTFGVKISKSGSTIIEKPEEESIDNMVTQHLPGIIGFYKGLFKGDSNVEFDESILANSDLSDTIYNSKNLLEVLVNSGTIRFKNKSGALLSIESNKKAHNGMSDTGNVIYANATAGNIEDSDTNTAYSGPINFLLDKNGDIKTRNSKVSIGLSSTSSMIYLEDVNLLSDKFPYIRFYKLYQNGSGIYYSNIKLEPVYYLSRTDEEGNIVRSSWRNVMELSDNIHIKANNAKDTLGSIKADGFIFVGDCADTNTDNNPAAETVIDMTAGGQRYLQKGDIKAKQVWSAVYNDIAEIFNVSDNLVGKEIVGLLLAVDKKHPDNYVIADKNNTAIVGVISENPAFCCGGKDCKNGVPVALAGRVNVKYEGKKPKIGDFVKLSNRTPGYTTKCRHNHKYRCGKVVDIIDESTVKILVLL